MKIQKWIAIGSLLIGAALIQSCGKKEVRSGSEAEVGKEPIATATHEAGALQPAEQAKPAAGDLAIVDWGPKATKAGQPFNVQANNISALWFVLKQVSPDLVVMMSNVELPAPTINTSNNMVSVSVPADLIERAGRLEVTLVDKKTGQKSKPVVFVVE